MSVQRSIRLQAKTQESLNAIGGSLGEVFYDRTRQTLRLMDGSLKGGFTIANRDWLVLWRFQAVTTTCPISH
jgi:hypothetical protein